MNTFRLYPLGDAALVIELGETVSEEILWTIQRICSLLEVHPVAGMIEYVPAFTTVTLFYNPVLTSFNELEKQIKPVLSEASGQQEVEVSSSLIEIPVLYGGSSGPDLEEVAAYHKLSKEQVVKFHTAPVYLVHMIGFAPGFPYLGGMDAAIATPRKETPRLKIPPGSVGIGGMQTGVYPIETPGGWQIIGRTPVKLFDSARTQPSLLKAGDKVKFVAISENEFERLAQNNAEQINNSGNEH